ncbi:MAG: 3-deoxy-7-phosphoheptulonate synthase [Candidatus Omnitrophica bacterium]|nr:3-deoxy-7-phosphoheptulonate synthase [Candidatus Omnitrophota bacterium]
MIVVMKRGFQRAELEDVIALIEEKGARPMISHAEHSTLVGVIDKTPGEKHGVSPDALSSLPGVEKIVPIEEPYKLVGRPLHPEDTVICIEPENGVRFQAGGGYFGVIAGPCAVESEEQIVETARAVRLAGGTALRGGAFKPRTSPYSFQGLKEEGLKMLAAARRETGLAVVTEVLCVNQVDLTAEYADVLQIGSRNMQNYPLLEAVGRQSNPVLLKRGLCSTLSEFLLAAEYIAYQGNPNIILCERGVRTFEDDTRFTLSLSSIPILQKKSHLPVIVDPSHSTGCDYLIAPMSRAAMAAGADGLMIEAHPHPSQSRVDAEQAIDCGAFAALMDDLRRLAPAAGKRWSE